MLVDLLKKTKEYKEFVQEVRADRIAHAYALISDDARVTYAYTNLLASALLCKTACGTCPTCEKVYARTHADIKIYDAVKVAEASKMLDDAYTKSFEGGLKVYFINNAEAVTPLVQNKLLKLVEEPPKGCVFILTTANFDALLPTIKSRVQKLFAPRLTRLDIKAVLMSEGAEEPEALLAASAANNSLSRAEKILGDLDYQDAVEEVFTVLKSCVSTKKIPAYVNKKCFSKDQIPRTIDIMETVFRDTLTALSGKNNFISANRDYDLRELAATLTPASNAEILQLFLDARRTLLSNCSPAAVADTLLFKTLEAKYKWR